MTIDTAGNLIIFYDMCAYCLMDTGGRHELHCPCYNNTFLEAWPKIDDDSSPDRV